MDNPLTRSAAATVATVRLVDGVDQRLRQFERSTKSAIDKLTLEVRQLREVLNAGGAGRRRRLETLPPDELETEMAALREWVSRLVRTYELEVIFPSCWSQHPGIVQELRALAEWHRAVFDELANDPRALTTWHEALGRFQSRALPVVVNRCVTRHHERGDAQRAESARARSW